MKSQVEEVDPTEPKRFEGEVMKIWDDITHELLESFINSMPRRIDKCIESRGGKIEY
jgi:hypothetical protein